MHLIFPDKRYEENPNEFDSSYEEGQKLKKKTYYEVGCKIFEINKFFR